MRFLVLAAFVLLLLPLALAGEQLLVYQGAWQDLGTPEEIAEIVAVHDAVSVTHAFYLTDETWTNGHCLDASYSGMETMLRRARELNPDLEIYGYAPATADNTIGCWVNLSDPACQAQPGVCGAYDCPGGLCSDFVKWVNLWTQFEDDTGITIDGIKIDMVAPQYISTTTRDNVFSYVKAVGKKVMANVLSADAYKVDFAAESPYFGAGDIVLIEGFYIAAGTMTSTDRLDNLGQALTNAINTKGARWMAIASEDFNVTVQCGSSNMNTAAYYHDYYGGSGLWYQGADIGTQTKTVVYCPRDSCANECPFPGAKDAGRVCRNTDKDDCLEWDTECPSIPDLLAAISQWQQNQIDTASLLTVANAWLSC